MKKHINFNTEKKMKAANGFEKKFLKLMINSVYGKAMGNLRKRIIVRLVKDFLMDKIFSNILAGQHILLIKLLAKIMLLFMKLNQF